MLALTSAQTGDIAYRSDVGYSFRLQGRNPELRTDWQPLFSGSSSGTPSNEAETNSPCEIGSPLYLLETGNLELASADVISTAQVCGLAVASASTGFGVAYQSQGAIERSSWETITGSTELIPGSLYYLGSTAGTLSATAPDSGVIVAVGRALTLHKISIEIQPSIRL